MATIVRGQHSAAPNVDRNRQRPGKIEANPEVQEFVREHLKQRWSPRQISNRLRANFPQQPEMHIVPETVYQALYGRGSLDLAVDSAVSLRSGRTGRRPRRRKEHRTMRFPDMVMIRDRPAEVMGRLVPGHWQGDLIIGKGGRSAIATLVERTTRFIILVHLAGNRGAENLRDRLADSMSPHPPHLRRSLTWDQDTEMACHQSFTRQTLIPVYFCDPASPGSAAQTRTLMACSGSTSPKEQTSASTARNTSPASPLNSAAVTMAHFSTVTDKHSAPATPETHRATDTTLSARTPACSRNQPKRNQPAATNSLIYAAFANTLTVSGYVIGLKAAPHGS